MCGGGSAPWCEMRIFKDWSKGEFGLDGFFSLHGGVVTAACDATPLNKDV